MSRWFDAYRHQMGGLGPEKEEGRMTLYLEVEKKGWRRLLARVRRQPPYDIMVLRARPPGLYERDTIRIVWNDRGIFEVGDDEG